MLSKPLLPRVLILLAFVLVSCGRPELARQDAAKLIENSSFFSEESNSTLLMHDNGKQLGFELGWWTFDRGNAVNFSPAIRSEGSAVTTCGWMFDCMVVNKPVRIAVSVTGITGDTDQTVRTVAFDWQYKDLPPLSRRIAIQGGQGKAMFRLFDDGWRLAEIGSMTTHKSPYPLSEQDKQAIARDLASERERRAATEQALSLIHI